MGMSGQEVVLQSVDELLRELLVRIGNYHVVCWLAPLCIVCILCFFLSYSSRRLDEPRLRLWKTTWSRPAMQAEIPESRSVKLKLVHWLQGHQHWPQHRVVAQGAARAGRTAQPSVDKRMLGTSSNSWNYRRLEGMALHVHSICCCSKPRHEGTHGACCRRSQSERIENAGTSQRLRRCCRVEMVGEREHEPDSAGCHSSLLLQIVSYSLRGSAALEQRLPNL